VVEEPVTDELRFRRPTEDDFLPIVRVVDEWWGGRRLHHLLPRLWFQHFTGTSWVAETDDGRLAGFLVGFVSPDRPAEAYVHMVAANPNLRRRGVGRRLYDRFIDDVRDRGARRVTAITWPGNRSAIAFHRAIGFSLDDGPGSQPIYGVPAFSDYDEDRDDKAVLTRDV
jgi:ribosomal protein S18 acetylase RimI-like enzyme